MHLPLAVHDYDSARKRGLDHDDALANVGRRRNMSEQTLEGLLEIRDAIENQTAPDVIPIDWYR